MAGPPPARLQRADTFLTYFVPVATPHNSRQDKAAKAKRDADKKAHMYALHGRATVVAACLQGVPDLAVGLPRRLTDHAFGTAEALCNRQVKKGKGGERPSMRAGTHVLAGVCACVCV